MTVFLKNIDVYIIKKFKLELTNFSKEKSKFKMYLTPRKTEFLSFL